MRWFSTPLYGALTAWAIPWAKRLGLVFALWLLAGVGLGAAGAVAARRLLK
jgi:hypothetical protein